MRYNATNLRKHIYQVLDRVADTGEAVEVERKGRLLRIVSAEPGALGKRLKPLKNLLRCDPGELDKIDWSSEWKP